MKQRNNYFDACSVFDTNITAGRNIIISIATFTAYSANTHAQQTPVLARPEIVVPKQIGNMNTIDTGQVKDVRTLKINNSF